MAPILFLYSSIVVLYCFVIDLWISLNIFATVGSLLKGILAIAFTAFTQVGGGGGNSALSL